MEYRVFEDCFKDDFMIVDELEIFDSVENLIIFLTDLAKQGHYVFRGYSYKKQMQPSILRQNFVDQEQQLLVDFELHASQYFSVTTPLEFLSYAQHFGLPTRLLDFTYNPFVALAFALYESKNEDTCGSLGDECQYYYISYADKQKNIMLDRLTIYIPTVVGYSGLLETLSEKVEIITNSLSAVYENKSSPCKYVKEIENNREKINNGKIVFVNPAISNPRISMQQGLFMLPYTLELEKHEELLSTNLRTIKICRDMRAELNRYLSTIGCSMFKLMPDLASTCKTIVLQKQEKCRIR